MTDRELLEAAAKAAGIRLWFGPETDPWIMETVATVQWRPLTDDGDALRLAVKLGLAVFPPEADGDDATVSTPGLNRNWLSVPVDDDPCTATRHAIVRAAAEIGKAMK